MSRVIILLSDKRSGSTMFQDEFCRHPDVQTVPYTPHTYLETHWWLMAAVLLDRPHSLFVSNSVYSGYGSARNARAYMLDLLEKCAPDFRVPEDNRALVFDGWDALCRAYARPAFFEKSPQHLAQWASLSLMLEWMEGTDFDVKIIGLVRNPHGALYSASKLFGTDPQSRQFAWMKGGLNLLALEKILGPDVLMRVRYEDIVENPKDTFAQILRFCGLVQDPSVGMGTEGGSLEKWMIDPAYCVRLDPSVTQVARSLGYGSESLSNDKVLSAVGEEATAGETRRKGIRLWLNRRRDRFVQPMLLRLRAALRGWG
ncbi:MAG: sulfotransferase [Pseudomonadota bacterium]